MHKFWLFLRFTQLLFTFIFLVKSCVGLLPFRNTQAVPFFASHVIIVVVGWLNGRISSSEEKVYRWLEACLFQRQLLRWFCIFLQRAKCLKLEMILLSNISYKYLEYASMRDRLLYGNKIRYDFSFASLYVMRSYPPYLRKIGQLDEGIIH